MLAQRVHLPALRGAVRRQEPLGHSHGPKRPRPRVGGEPPAHAHELHRAAAEIQHEAVAQRRRVDRGDVAVARLRDSPEHADRKTRRFARSGEELACVLGVADRARRDRVDLVRTEVACAHEMREHVERRERARDRLLAELAALREALADTHRLVDLIRAHPPPVACREHDQAKRVRTEINHREPLERRHARASPPPLRMA